MSLAVGDVVVKVSTFVSLTVVARVFGPEAFGQWSLAQTLTIAASSTLGLSLVPLLQRRMLAEPDHAGPMLASGIRLQWVAVAIFALPVVAALAMTDSFGTTGQLIVALSPLILAQAVDRLFVLHAYQQLRAWAAVRGGSQLLAATAIAVTAWATEDLRLVAVASWSGLLFSAIVSSRLSAALVPAGRPQRRFMRQLVGEGRHYIGIMLVTLAVQYLDIVIIGLTRTGAEVGAYAAAYRLYALPVTFLGLGITATYPLLVSLAQADDSRVTKVVIRDMLGACAAVGVAVSFLLIIAGPDIAATLFGAEFDGSAVPLQLLAAAVPLALANTVLVQVLLSSGKQRDYLRGMTVTALLSLTALLLVVPNQGIVAAAIIMIGGEIVSLGWLAVVARHSIAHLGSQWSRIAWWWLASLAAVAVPSLTTSNVLIPVLTWGACCAALEAWPATSTRKSLVRLT